MSRYDATYEYVNSKNYALYRAIVEHAFIATADSTDKALAFRVERTMMSLVADILKGVYDRKEIEQRNSSLPSRRSQDNAWEY